MTPGTANREDDVSYTTVMAIWPGEKIEDFEELRNSWGSAPVIWDFMARKYLPEGNGFSACATGTLWPLWKREDIPQHHRAVLMMTYDCATVPKDKYAQAAADIRAWLVDLRAYGGVNHWPRLAEIFESQPDIPALGLYCTSVSDNPFLNRWDDEKDEPGQPKWADMYSVYDELAKVGGAQ